MDETTGRGGPSPNDKELLTNMLDYTLQHFYKDIFQKDISQEEKYLQMYQEVLTLTVLHNYFLLHQKDPCSIPSMRGSF